MLLMEGKLPAKHWRGKMFEIVCEVANTSGKTLTIETSIPEAEKPDVQILKSGQQMGVFASPTRSTVKITVVSVEASDRIEKLEAALRWICGSRTIEYFDGTVQADETKMLWTYRRIAREALEGIYDERIFKDPT